MGIRKYLTVFWAVLLSVSLVIPVSAEEGGMGSDRIDSSILVEIGNLQEVIEDSDLTTQEELMEDLEDLADQMDWDNIDYQKLEQMILKAEEILSSPEVHAFAEYASEHVEVQELIKQILIDSVNFMQTERSTTREILQTLGVGENWLRFYDIAMDMRKAAVPVLEFALSTEAGQRIKTEMTYYLGTAGVDEVINTILQILSIG